MMKVNPYHVLNLRPREEFPCLSLYASSERDFVKLMDKAEEIGLKEYDAKVLDALLKPIHGFLKKYPKESFASPLALFSSKGFAGYSKLPFQVRPLAVVASSFHVKPLLKWMQREHPFSLLLLNENEAILHQGSLSHFEEIERLPYLELRTMDGVFHALDRAVYRSVQSSRVPLLLAGDFDMIEAYKSISGYKAIVDDVVLEPSIFQDQQKLHKAAIEILEPYLEQKESALLQSYWAAERAGRTSSTLQEIIQLALVNRVKHLFVNEKLHVWGKINKSSANFTYSPNQMAAEDDVLDDLAEIVLRNHGSVTVLPSFKMPDGKAACAILSGETFALRRNLKTADTVEREQRWRPAASL